MTPMIVKTTLFALVLLISTSALAQTAPAGAPFGPPGAMACSGCHARPGTVGVVPTLAGRLPDEIVATLQAYRAGQRPTTVMDRIAKGFSDEEMRAIAAFVSAQR